MKNKKLLKLYELITSIEGKPAPIKFSHVIAKTKIKIKEEVNILDELRKPTKEFAEYDSKRVRIAIFYAEKDESGQPKIINNNFIISTEMISEFQQKIEELRKENKEIIDEQEQREKELEKLLNDESDFNPVLKLDIKDMPKEIEPVIVEILLEAKILTESNE